MNELRVKTLFLSLILLSSCALNKKSKSKVLSGDVSSPIYLELARLTMIPEVPLGFAAQQVIYDQSNPCNVQVMYRVQKHMTVDLEKLADGYCVDMEMLGWELSGMFKQGHEILLLFARPNFVSCQILIERVGLITVTVMSKK